MTTISIMQPYFIPYAGYFRLIAGVDIFVIYDCVQFPRRGWVHRNFLRNKQGIPQWITLPLQKGPQSIKIKDLFFQEELSAFFHKQRTRFPSIDQANDFLCLPDSTSLVSYLSTQLQSICCFLKVNLPQIIFSSSLTLPDSLKKQDRILEICHLLQATHYINSPGGIDLYDEDIFKERGITLKILTPFKGSYISILDRLVSESKEKIYHDITSQITFQN